tara:strand:- start:6440 stop:6613 length:174 start_codon:yes stop_codon:yes gene_type:complete
MDSITSFRFDCQRSKNLKEHDAEAMPNSQTCFLPTYQTMMQKPCQRKKINDFNGLKE